MGLSGKLCEEWLAGKIERRKVVFAPGVAEARAAAEAAVVAALHARGVTDLREASDVQLSVFEAESKVRDEVARRGRPALQAKLVARRAPEKAEEAQRAAAEKAEKAQRAAAEKAERVAAEKAERAAQKAQRAAAAAAQRAAAAAAAMEAQRAALVRQELEQLQLLCRVQGGTRGGALQPYSGPEEARAEAHVRIWVLGQVNKRLLASPGLRVLEAQAGQASSEAAAAAAQLAQRRRASVLQALAAFQSSSTTPRAGARCSSGCWTLCAPILKAPHFGHQTRCFLPCSARARPGLMELKKARIATTCWRPSRFFRCISP
jgi:colicin import membrane protein